MIVLLLIIIACCLLFGGEQTKEGIITILAFFLFLGLIGLIFC